MWLGLPRSSQIAPVFASKEDICLVPRIDQLMMSLTTKKRGDSVERFLASVALLVNAAILLLSIGFAPLTSSARLGDYL